MIRSCARRRSVWPHCGSALALALIAGTAAAHPPSSPPNPLDPPFIPPPAAPPPVIEEPPPAASFDPTAEDEPDDKPPARRALDPAEVTGILSPEREPADTMRDIGNVLLFPPRESFGVLFVATRYATALVEQRQIVPKINEFTREKRGEITLFPTIFFDPNRRPSLGGFMVTGGPGGTSTSIRVGSGGPNEALLETRISLTRGAPRPFSLVGEALYDMRTSLQYLGVGQHPEQDRRNQFQEPSPLSPRIRDARYRHQRVRAILSGGVRPTENVELFLSSSYTTHIIDDSPDDPGRTMSFVFVPGTVPGGPTGRRAFKGTIVYSEIAARLDTRDELGPPREGAYTEGYLGYGTGLGDNRSEFARFGFRGAVFLSIFRKTNIISPKLVVDQIAPLGRAPIPFFELAREADYRGFTTRRDNLSTTVSLDYRWGFAPQISGRLFVDLSSVGSELSRLGGPRWVVGFGQDIYASAHDIGSWAFSFGPEGIAFFLSFGVPSRFGDRQHRG